MVQCENERRALHGDELRATRLATESWCADQRAQLKKLDLANHRARRKTSTVYML